MSKRANWRIGRTVIGLLVLFVLASTLVWAPGGGLGEGVAAQPRPTITPIPRPTLPVGSGDDKEQPAEGARIILQVKTKNVAAQGWWTVVQWRDRQGGWHNVDGWRGHLGAGQRVRWWVAPEQGRQGMFRWQILRSSADSEVLWTSNVFVLPANGNDLVVEARLD